MSARGDGGPAFPLAHDVEPPQGYERAISIEAGMSLRDYFAGHAMQGICADSVLRLSVQEAANAAYEIADAMLAARKRDGDAS